MNKLREEYCKEVGVDMGLDDVYDYCKWLENKINKHINSHEFIGKAVTLSKYADEHLGRDEAEDIEKYLPCRAYYSGIDGEDGGRIIRLEGMVHYEDFVHEDFLVIEDDR